MYANVEVKSLNHVGSQVDQTVVKLAAHQQRPTIGALLQVIAVSALDLDGAQHLQAEQGQDSAIALWAFLVKNGGCAEQ
jgi:hypothetical protein